MNLQASNSHALRLLSHFGSINTPAEARSTGVP
eukprot:CAMPEP_0194756176 /NCGR_PEP_ID=MMETSP0323_2-20130528/9921_1 /TAXON_ID=2866 ORGANISM="Crypthecodinium cohnii, Strain Seligo" /NCGR_SAMPLE_ID=MMETSP0323_2 /ASSEMBLY_ACC=CAM_ASM_000346 /LENGTH=32 /DNA_ID= /DNA_START= /DNA_END= /DNA_ORIENTATION=